MRVVIIGAGNAGGMLAAKLCKEQHDVVVVDINPEPLAELQSQLDILTITGEGSSPRVLEEAEISKAEMLVAVTDRDAVNVLACALAHAAGVPRTAARVSNPDYIRPPARFDLKRLGINLIVSQKEECARELFNILRMPGTLEAVDLLEGRILAVGVKVHMDSPLLRGTLKAFPKPELLNSIRFIALRRGDDVVVPRGDTQFMVGDDIYFVGRQADLATFMAWAWPEQSSFRKVMIAGGSDLGVHLAQLLEGAGIQVVLLEENVARADFCSSKLDRTLVIKGNPLDQETLKNAGIVEETAYAAVTDSDEHNIIGCMIASGLKARFTLAQVATPEYVPIINSMSLLDRAVSPPLSMINAILHFVRGQNVRDAVVFQNLPGEVLDTVLTKSSRWAGRAIKDIRVPEGAVIASVLRRDQIHVATGDLVLAAGDRLVVFAVPKALGKLDRLLRH